MIWLIVYGLGAGATFVLFFVSQYRWLSHSRRQDVEEVAGIVAIGVLIFIFWPFVALGYVAIKIVQRVWP